MLGGLLGDKIEVLDARQTETAILDLIDAADGDADLWLISPYASFDTLTTIRRRIETRCSDGARIKVVVRDEKEQTGAAAKALAAAMKSGLELFAVKRLHAKIYLGEEFMVAGSANLYDGSFDKSVEIGFVAQEGSSLYGKVQEFIELHIVPQARRIDGKTSSATRKPRAKSAPTTSGSRQGYCIRCATSIPRDTSRPYCREHYESWAKFKNPGYVDKVCHGCGTKFSATMAKPVCSKCYRAG